MSNKQKKEPPPKKRKVDPAPVVIGGPKPSFRPGASTTSVKNRLSASLGPSPSNQYDTPSSCGTGNIAKTHADNLNVTPVKTRGGESMVASEKDLSTWESNALRNTSGRQETNVNEEIDLHVLLADLLKEAPMSFKALAKKAVGDRTPNEAKLIEPILKKIPNFQAPSSFLKPGADLEIYKNHSTDSKSSPEHQQLLQITDSSRDQLPVPGVSNMENFSVCERKREGSQDSLHVHLEEKLSAQENVDIEKDLPGILHEETRFENRDGQARISNSESDNDNNDSGSDRGSSSDSEASSDEDVDIIMSDGDKEQSAERDAIDLPSAEIEGFKKKLPEVSVSHKSTPTARDLQEAELQLLEQRLQFVINSTKLFKNRAACEASQREFQAEEFGRLKLDIGSLNDRVNHLYEYFSASHKRRKRVLVVEPLVQFPAICKDSQPSERKYDLEHLNASAGQLIDPLKKLQKSSTESLSRYGQMNPGDSSGKSNKHSDALGNVRGGNDQNRSSRESKRHKEATSMNGPKDATLIPGESVVREKRTTSFEEECPSYLKYEKAAADPKGPISDHLQFKEYRQEYLEKYDDYCSVNKIVESYRNDFEKLGEGLEFAKKARDMEAYNKIMQDLNESYSKYGEGHKRLKKVFIVLHEELTQLKGRMKDYVSSAASERENERLCIISPEKI